MGRLQAVAATAAAVATATLAEAAKAAAMPPSCCIDLANMHFYSLTTRPANSNSNNGNKFLYYLFQADGQNAP